MIVSFTTKYGSWLIAIIISTLQMFADIREKSKCLIRYSSFSCLIWHIWQQNYSDYHRFLRLFIFILNYTRKHFLIIFLFKNTFLQHRLLWHHNETIYKGKHIG
jgi:hypothetical protein